MLQSKPDVVYATYLFGPPCVGYIVSYMQAYSVLFIYLFIYLFVYLFICVHCEQAYSVAQNIQKPIYLQPVGFCTTTFD